MRRLVTVNLTACFLLLVQYLLGKAVNVYVVMPGKHRAETALALLGGLAVIGAGFNGASFLSYGKAFSSMIMAGLWAVALACYVAAALLAARPAQLRRQREPIRPMTG